MSTSVRNALKISVLLVVLGSMSGCVKTGTTGSTTTSNISFVTLMNMAPYSAQTTIYFNSQAATSAVAAGAYSASYSSIPAGSYDVQFKKAGADSIMSELPASNYDSLGFYTLILYNSKDSSAKSMKIKDDFSGLSLSAANYRFFQLSPDLGTVDLYLNSNVAQSGRSLADNASYGLYNTFQTVTAGSYQITAKKAGTDSVIATLNTVSLSSANAYTIFLQGSSSNSSDPVSLKVLLASY